MDSDTTQAADETIEAGPRIRVSDHGNKVDRDTVTILVDGAGKPFSAISREALRREGKEAPDFLTLNRKQRREMAVLRRKQAKLDAKRAKPQDGEDVSEAVEPEAGTA